LHQRRTHKFGHLPCIYFVDTSGLGAAGSRASSATPAEAGSAFGRLRARVAKRPVRFTHDAEDGDASARDAEISTSSRGQGASDEEIIVPNVREAAIGALPDAVIVRRPGYRPRMPDDHALALLEWVGEIYQTTDRMPEVKEYDQAATVLLAMNMGVMGQDKRLRPYTSRTLYIKMYYIRDCVTVRVARSEPLWLRTMSYKCDVPRIAGRQERRGRPFPSECGIVDAEAGSVRQGLG
jgi:hypothetical protein